MHNYGINEIQSLSFKDGVRTRIQIKTLVSIF